MTERIIDLAESAAYLHVRNRQLVIERHPSRGLQSARTHDPDGTSDSADAPVTPADWGVEVPTPTELAVPLCEVAALIVAHPQVQCSQPVLAELMNAGTAFIVCDARSLPVGMMLPLSANTVQAQRLIAQASAPLPLKKQLWKQIVRRKITAQAELLTELRGGDHGLADLARDVRSGDPDNRESVAARRYWPVLFDDPNFHRRFDARDANRLLNYGYAVLRAAMARAICGAGLHPTLGLHHHQRDNPFCLADDLIEPYRPLIDAAVVEHVRENRGTELDRIGKQSLLEAVLARYDADGEVRTLFDLCARTAVSLVQTLERQTDRLDYPKKLGEAPSAPRP
ncbi:MAG: type II CRISPR-associated endonuclease Cas1 [Phycisphaerales bacterium]|nr:type II CRISPR-associated endonuclease Cas1 [Phycisphaerales bacterium]